MPIMERANPMGGTNSNTLLNAYQAWGTDVEGMTTEEALTYTGLAGWGQHLVEPTIIDADGTVYPAANHRHIVANIPGVGPKVLGSVTDRYQPVDNETAFTPLLDSLQGGGFQPVTMGAWDGGRSAFALFRTPEGTTPINGDPVEHYFLATKRNDGQGGISGYPTAIRARCANEIGGIIRRATQALRVHHTRRADQRFMEQVEVLLGVTSEWDRGLAVQVREMQARKVTKRQFTDKVVPEVIGRPRADKPGNAQTTWDQQFDAIVSHWNSDTAPEGQTAWRAWNAVSEWEQHYRSDNAEVMAKHVLQNVQPYSRRALAVLTA